MDGANPGEYEPGSDVALLDPGSPVSADPDPPTGNEGSNNAGSNDALWQMMVVQLSDDGDSALTLIQGEPEENGLNITSEEMDIVWDGASSETDSEEESDFSNESPSHCAKDAEDSENEDPGGKPPLEEDDDQILDDLGPDLDPDPCNAVPQDPMKKKAVQFKVQPLSLEDISLLSKADPNHVSNGYVKPKHIPDPISLTKDQDKDKPNNSMLSPKSPNILSSDDSYYDTNSSTTSSVPLLAKSLRDLPLLPPLSVKASSCGDLPKVNPMPPASGPCSEARPVHPEFSTGIGKALLTETLEHVKKSLEELTPGFDDKSQEASTERLKRTYLKNLFVLSLSIMLVHAPFYALRNLQSSINHVQGLGLIAMAFTGITYITGCILGTSLVSKIRPKWTLLMGLSGFFAYILANFHATFYTLLPATAILGFTMANLWVAQGTYLTSIAISYAVLTGRRHDNILVLFNGFFLFFLQFSQIVGNLVCSSVLKMGLGEESKDSDVMINGGDSLEHIKSTDEEAMAYIESPILAKDHDGLFMSTEKPYTYPNMSNFHTTQSSSLDVYYDVTQNWNTTICGAAYCHSYKIDHASFDINPGSLSALLGIFAGFCVVGMAVMGFFLDKLDVIFRKNNTQVWRQLLGVAHLHRQARMLLFIPWSVFLGAQACFVYGDVTKAFVTCPVGVHMVGYVMMCFGACDSTMAFISGPVQKLVGRKVMIYSVAALHMGLFVTMYLWKPLPEQQVYIFLLAGGVGICDAVWQTQACSVCGLMFKEREASFAALRIYESVGFTIAAAIANYLCMQVKLIMLAVTLVITVSCYSALEFVLVKQDGKNPPVLV